MRKMSNYTTLAQEIVKNVGGKENVISLTHCITRLRFKLADESKAHDDVIKNLKGVVTVMKSGGQYQVVIGNEVDDVYQAILPLLDLAANKQPEAQPKGVFSTFVDVISGIFQPILGIMAAAGMIKGFNTLFYTLGMYSDKSGTYILLNALGDALFMFLPIVLGYTSAKKFQMKPMTGMVLGMIMCYPAIQKTMLAETMKPLFYVFHGTPFEAPVYLKFLGLPIISMDYTATVVPVIFVVYVSSKLEKWFNNWIPNLVKFFFVPMLTILIAGSLGLLVVGPVLTFASTFIAEGIMAIRNFSPMLAGLIVGLTWQVLVIFGLHWAFIPVYINNIMTQGYDNVMMPFFACTFATSAVVLAIFFKTKDQKLKEMCLPNFISGIFGVTEPAIYGILLPLKKPFIISCLAGGLGGAFYGALNFRKFVMGGMGIFEFPAMMNPNGSMTNMYVALSGVALTMLVAFILTFIMFKDQPNDNEELINEVVEQAEQTIITAPIAGDILPLNQVQDDVFATGVLGEGVAIIPTGDTVVAPCAGIVTTLFPTGHAVGLTTETGVELLIHIGIDTVQLNGQGFTTLIEQGALVQAGDPLIKIDQQQITSAGYLLETPVIVTNSQQFTKIDLVGLAKEQVTPTDQLIIVN